MIKAAQDRESAWNKKVVAGRSGSSKQNDEAAFKMNETIPLNPETERLIALTKEQEARTVAEMGYNPFKPHMNSNSSDVRSQMTSSLSGIFFPSEH